MKFGVLTYLPTAEQRNWKHNLGDFVQTIAVRNLYRQMGVQDEDIIEVNLFQLNEYNGEYCILPMNSYNFPWREGKNYLPPSPKIIPVYISFNLIAHTIGHRTLDNLRGYQPVGCRDEATMELLRGYGIQAYLTGCITATLPRRREGEDARKVFIVDAQQELFPFIPKGLLENAVYRTQLITDAEKPTQERIGELYQLAVRRLTELKEEAALVITRRLHVASPCIAMGIPVILARNYWDTRYGWIERYVHPYSLEEYGNIDWNPAPVEYEEEKEELLRMYKGQIRKACGIYKDYYEISQRFEERERCRYQVNYIRMLEHIKIEENKKIHFIIWGVFIHAPYLLQLIPRIFHEYEITIVDSYISGKIEDYNIYKPDVIETLPDGSVCLVTAPSIVEPARKLLEGTGKQMVILECCDK